MKCSVNLSNFLFQINTSFFPSLKGGILWNSWTINELLLKVNSFSLETLFVNRSLLLAQ